MLSTPCPRALSRAMGSDSFDLEVCPAEKVACRAGWPPLPGDYTVLRYQAPVAVCTLMDESLAVAVAQKVGPEVAMVCTLKTENLGEACAARDPGPAEPFESASPVIPIPGNLPLRVVADPAGYFVVCVDRRRGVLSLEHYRTDGVLNAVIEGGFAGEVYTPVIELNLVTRLDHAAYLGRELARAETALVTGEAYVQHGAPEESPPLTLFSAGCSNECRESAS